MFQQGMEGKRPKTSVSLTSTRSVKFCMWIITYTNYSTQTFKTFTWRQQFPRDRPEYPPSYRCQNTKLDLSLQTAPVDK